MARYSDIDRVVALSAVYQAAQLAQGIARRGMYDPVALDVSIGGMMAVTTGVFLITAFLFGPRYGLLAGLMRRWSERYANESRTLAVHLYHHEGRPECLEESARAALQSHLNWTRQKADDVVRRSLASDLVRQRGDVLELTENGRTLARQLLEPWRQKEDSSLS